MPWICEKCGEVADGAMCLKCGYTKPHRPVRANQDVYPYTSGPIVEESRARDRAMTWGPMSWIALVLFCALMGLFAFATTR